MSKWTDPEEWARRLTPEGCPICVKGRPTFVLAELEVSRVTMGEEPPPLPGTCGLFLRRHAVELHDLGPEEAAAYMRDIQRLSRALQAATGAVKLNYEVHGNTIPHLQMHFFPRYAGDPFEGGPIDPRAVKGKVYPAAEHQRIRQQLAAALVHVIRARWSCEQVHMQLKQELGLDHFEGRSWTGLHRHALLSLIAFCFLQYLRLGGVNRQDTSEQSGTAPESVFAAGAPGFARSAPHAGADVPALAASRASRAPAHDASAEVRFRCTGGEPWRAW